MKLLATDYDGTLKFGDSVAQEDLDALRSWKKEGNLFAIVTGRSLESILLQTKEFDLPVDYFVTNNGGMVFDSRGNELMSTQLDTLTAVDLMFAAHEMPGVVSYMVNDGINRHKVVIQPGQEDHRYAHIAQDWTEERIMDSGTFAQIVFSCTTPEIALELCESINHFFGESVTAYANNFVVDVVPHGVSKATGLTFVTAYTEVDDDDVYAIGDSYNDLPMLEEVYNSAAMEVAPAIVQENVREVYPSVAAFIDAIEKQ